MATEETTTAAASVHSTEVALELLPLLKEELGEAALAAHGGAKDYNLLKFLRWKAVVKLAADRYNGLQKWRQENPNAFDTPPLQASMDPKLKDILQDEVVVAPTGMRDMEGRTVLVGRLRNNDMSKHTADDVIRMIIYTIDRVLEEENAQKNGVVIFHDLRGLSPSNLHPAIPKKLLGAIIGHFPIRIKGIYILDAPWFFKGMFNMISVLMPAKLRQRTQFVTSMDDIYQVIPREEMLQEHGGNRTFDIYEWVDTHIQREQDGTVQSLRDCFLHQPTEAEHVPTR